MKLCAKRSTYPQTWNWEEGELTLRKFPLLVRKAVSIAKNNKAGMIFSFRPLFQNLKISNEMLAETVAFNLNLANYKFVNAGREPSEGWEFIDEIIMAGKYRPRYLSR